MRPRGTVKRIARRITSVWLVVSMLLAAAGTPSQTTTNAAPASANVGQAIGTGVALALAAAAVFLARPQSAAAQVAGGSMDQEVASGQTTLPGACFPYGQYTPLYTFAPGAAGQAVLQATVSGYGTGCFGGGPDAIVGIQCPGDNPVTNPNQHQLSNGQRNDVWSIPNCGSNGAQIYGMVVELTPDISLTWAGGLASDTCRIHASHWSDPGSERAEP
jgi:hypothetical protein